MNIACFAAERLDPVWRRRKHIMTRFQNAGHKVLFVEAPLAISDSVRDPAAFRTELRRRTRTVDGLTGFRPLWPVPLTRLTSALRLNLMATLSQVDKQAERLGMKPWSAWVSQPFWGLAADGFRHGLVYDCTDDWSLMPGGDQRWVEWGRILTRKADVVQAVSRSLFDEARLVRDDVALIPNGVDFEHYQGTFSPPRELEGKPRPWLGYVGTIWDQRMDLELVAELARAVTGTIVLTGPVNPDTAAALSILPPNVLVTGPIPYSELPAWVHSFDVCLIPHRVNELTLSMDPIKVYEYLAAGKPVVSTPVAGLDPFGDLVYIADGPEQFILACQRALGDHRVRERLDMARKHSWDARFEQVIEGFKSAKLV